MRTEVDDLRDEMNRELKRKKIPRCRIEELPGIEGNMAIATDQFDCRRFAVKVDGEWHLTESMNSEADRGTLESMPFMVRDGTGGQSITGSSTTVNLDTEQYPSVMYILEGDAIKILKTGVYEIHYIVTAEVTDTAGGATCTMMAWVDEWKGSWSPITGSYSRCFIAENASGGASCTWGVIRQFDAGDIIRLRCNRPVGTTNIDLVDEQSCLTIKRLG